MTNKRELGRAIGIYCKALAAELFAHDDVDIMGAPGECHAIVARGEAKRLRQARRIAKSVSGLSRRAFNAEWGRLSTRVRDKMIERMYIAKFPF